MGTQFPVPVLSLAADAVRDLQGSEALSGLWTLFTKCKESLQDGRRLENISWRLWYREMMLLSLEREAVAASSPGLNEKFVDDELFDEKSTYPAPSITAIQPSYLSHSSHERGASLAMSPHQTRLSSGSAGLASASSPIPRSPPRRPVSPLLSPSKPENTRRPSISSSRRNSFRAGTPINVGQIIYDMIPSASSMVDSTKAKPNLVMPNGPTLSRKTTSTSTTSTSSLFDNVPDGSSTSSAPSFRVHDTRPNPCSIPQLPSSAICSNQSPGLPTPEMELEKKLSGPLLHQSASNEMNLSALNPEIPSSNVPRPHSPEAMSSESDFAADSAVMDESDTEDSSLHIPPDAYPSLPSPSLSDSYARAHPGEVAVKEVGLQSSLSVADSPAHRERQQDPEGSGSPSTPSITTMFSPSSASSIEPPQVVVVNPTPNLTPHPTPPATPLLQGTIGPGGVFKSQWLTLPEGAAGARQHQLLEAAYQQQLLAPHYSPLHLPPSQVPGTSRVGGSSNSNIQRNLGEGFAAGNHATRPTTTALSNGASSNSANSDYQQQQQLHHFDRSRSVSMGTCDPETARTGVGADGVISKQVGFVVPKEVLGQHHHQSGHHQAPQMRQQGQAEFGAATATAEYYPSRTGYNSASFTGVYGQQPQPQIHPQPPSTLKDSRGSRTRSPSSTTSNRSRNSITSDQASSSKGDGSFSTTSTTLSLSSDNVKPDTFHTGREVHNNDNNNNIYGAADMGELHQQSSYSTMTQTSTTSARRMGEDVIAGHGCAVSAKNRLPEEGVNNGTGVEADVEGTDRTSQLSHLPTHSQPSNSHSHSPNSALSASSSSSQKQRAKKRNSAPVLPATTTTTTTTAAPTASSSSAAMHVLSPTLSTGSGKHSSYLASSPGSMTDHSSARVNTNTKSKERKVHAVAAGGGLVRRTSSSGRSTSSLVKSRSRSREIGIGGGGLNMTAAVVAAVAAAVPPLTTRKAGAAARGRSTKVMFNRPGAKKGAIRRNSAGTTSAATAAATTAAASSAQGNEDEDVDLDLDMVDGEVEEMVHKLEEQFERAKERTDELEHQRMLQIAEERRLMLNREADKLVAQEQEMRVAEEVRQMEERQRNALVLDEIIANGEEGAAAAAAAGKRAAHFNIGSNSDSGVGSKSVSPNLPCEPTTEHMHVPEGSPTSRNSNNKGKPRAVEEPLIKQAQQDRQDLHEQEAMAMAARMAEVQKQQYQQQLQQNIPVQMQMERQLSKHQLAQLQAMERMHRQQHPTDLQRQQISRQQGQQKPLFSKRASSAQGSSVGSGSVEKREKSAKQKGKEKDVTIKVVKGSKSAIALDEKTVKKHIAAPLLPQKVRTIVVTSGSEFETDLEDDGSWSSEESTGDGKQQQKVEERQAEDEKLRAQLLEQRRAEEQARLEQEIQRRYQVQERQRQHQLQQMLLQQQQAHGKQGQQQHPPTRPPAVQRTQSSHYPGPNQGRGAKLTKAQQQKQAQLDAQAVEQAALEAQRQREMFVKLPTSSFQDLAKARSGSVGYLSQLMHPNPEIFPANHPYRRGFSSGAIMPGGLTALQPMKPISDTPAAAQSKQDPTKPSAAMPPPDPAAKPAAAQEPRPSPTKKVRISSRASPASSRPPMALQRSRGRAAMPISSVVFAGSLATKAPAPAAAAVVNATATTTAVANTSAQAEVQPKVVGSGGYRPRARPEDADLEDDDSGTEDATNNKILVSHSVAEERLKALANRSRIQPNTRVPTPEAQSTAQAQAQADDNAVPQWAKVSPAQQQNGAGPSQISAQAPSHGQPSNTQPNAPETAKPTPIPSKYEYPYTLPIAALPTTPRTTRRTMLSTEIPESLRHNVFWLHKVEREEASGIRRTASGGGSRQSVLGNQLGPLTAVPSVVKLHPKGTIPPGTETADDLPVVESSTRAREERRREAMARNKSWANDYHTSGW